MIFQFIDLYSRQVVGWSMANHMRSKLVNDALTMAIWKRKPKKGGKKNLPEEEGDFFFL